MTEPLLNVMKVMLLAGLYLFFFRVLWAITSDLRDPRIRTQRKQARSAKSQTPRETRQATLVVIEPAELSGSALAIGNDSTIGRDPTCTIRIDDSYVSSIHARLFLRNGMCYLEDLDSRNGTLINGELVEATTALQTGDQITVGATTMELR